MGDDGSHYADDGFVTQREKTPKYQRGENMKLVPQCLVAALAWLSRQAGKLAACGYVQKAPPAIASEASRSTHVPGRWDYRVTYGP